MQLPDNKTLNINTLSQIFTKTSATYKFYWFVGLLDILVKERKTKISFWEIIASMIAESWYPIHYFKISFGKSDSLFDYSQSIQKNLQIPIDADKTVIKAMILENLALVKRYLNKLDDNVPYWLLTPWFEKTSRRDIVLKSQRFENNCLYAIIDKEIEINPLWKDYLIENYAVLLDFTFWNLTEFLQKRNPNVPNLPAKLVKPLQRESLAKQRKFWDTYIESVGKINCIYTGKEIFAKKYDLDHFVPWSFVSHNLLWNLLPADASINSSKSNNLPPLDKYLKPFASMQHNALKTLYAQDPNNNIFEDYLTIFDSVSELIKMPQNEFCDVLGKTFTPLVQIAENSGFKIWQQ